MAFLAKGIANKILRYRELKLESYNFPGGFISCIVSCKPRG